MYSILWSPSPSERSESDLSVGINEDALKRRSSDPLDDDSTPDRNRLAFGLFSKDFLSGGGGGGNGGAPVFGKDGGFDDDLIAGFVDVVSGIGAGAGFGAGSGAVCCWNSFALSSGTLSIDVLDLLVLLSNSCSASTRSRRWIFSSNCRILSCSMLVVLAIISKDVLGTSSSLSTLATLVARFLLFPLFLLLVFVALLLDTLPSETSTAKSCWLGCNGSFCEGNSA